MHPDNTQTPMLPPVSEEKIIFTGKGKGLFFVMIVNMLLTIVTLGIYYPWAKVAYLKFVYSETEFKQSRFIFSGTGKEIFFGMLKAIGVVVVLFLLTAFIKFLGFPFLGAFIDFLVFAILFPIAIVGSLRYRASRSSWRGIHFGYRGKISTMLKINVLGFLLSVITFGIYYPWYYTNLIREIVGNLRMGSLKFAYTGRGGQYFIKLVIGAILTVITLGFYLFRYRANLHNYILNHIILEQEGNELLKGTLQANTTGWGFFKLMIGNFFIVVFTLGIATPWAIIRHLTYVCNTLIYIGNVDFETIGQTETMQVGATGEGFLDALDLQII